MSKIKPLNMKDMAIITAFPQSNHKKVVLEVGCGDGKIDWYLAEMGYRVYGTDIQYYNTWIDNENPSFHKSDIFDLSTFPIKSSPVVICSQVLEHLREYRLALVHLIAFTEVRLIITLPHRRSFRSSGHVNFWDDKASGKFKDVHEFIELCRPHSVSLSKIITKPKDAETGQRNYLMVIDKG